MIDMKKLKTITLTCGDNYKKFELKDDTGIYMMPDPQDDSQPYIIRYHDGRQDTWFTAEFLLGKKLDEGGYESICGGVTYCTPDDIERLLSKAE